MITTDLSKNIHDVFEHEPGELIDYNSLLKKTKYNVNLKIEYISLNNKQLNIKFKTIKIKCVSK
mgnify:FL=1